LQLTLKFHLLETKKYEKLWSTSKACVAVVNEDISIEPGENRAFIKVKNADLAMSQVLELLLIQCLTYIDITLRQLINQRLSELEQNRRRKLCWTKRKIGENAIIYPNVTILDECTIGKEYSTVVWNCS
jgi:UDP-3-O-[3-hydroxymyristoyl] glucosamine N-acyltransferase